MIYLRLFYEFFKTGLFAIGGGLATLPFLTDMGQRTGWFTSTELADMVAVSESTPGSIGINMASYVGYTTGGIPGVVAATLGEVTPSIIIITIIASLLKSFRDNKYVGRAFYGIRPASTGLIASACVSVMTICLLDLAAFSASGLIRDLVSLKSLALFITVSAFTNFVKPAKKLHPIFFIAASAAVGIALNLGAA